MNGHGHVLADTQGIVRKDDNNRAISKQTRWSDNTGYLGAPQYVAYHPAQRRLDHFGVLKLSLRHRTSSARRF
jgi:hypothetical protein